MKYWIFSILIALGLLIPAQIYAAGCESIYGGGLTCTTNGLNIKKEIMLPQSSVFVHDLGVNDAKFHANNTVTFRITVTNNTGNTINSILVKDILPTQLTFTDGPGKFDNKTSTDIFSIDSLGAHQAQVFTMHAKVESENLFPRNTFCISNQVTALTSPETITQDSTQFCIEKSAGTATAGNIRQTPATGPETLGLLAMIPTALLGFGLKRSARK